MEHQAEYDAFRLVMTGPSRAGGRAMFLSGFDLFGQVGYQIAKEKILRRKFFPPEDLKYIYHDELYICDGREIADNTCSVTGSNDDQCRMTFTIDPPLPQGLLIDRRSGTISGAIDYDSAPENVQISAMRPRRSKYSVTAKNLAGVCTVDVAITLIVAPREIVLAHTDITFRTGEKLMAWSTELLVTAKGEGWRRNPDRFFPIDLTHSGITIPDKNGLTPESFLGSAFSWRGEGKPPCIAGEPQDWEAPRAWPKYTISPELPEGMSLDKNTGFIEGSPEEEVSGIWELTCFNPAGASVARVAMRSLTAPHSMAYYEEESKLIAGNDIGELMCECKGTPVLNFRADLLPKGLKCDAKNGSIAGIPDQIDKDFISYFVLVANEVGVTTGEIRFLVDSHEMDDGEGDRIVNLNVEARIGQRVQGTPGYIRTRAMYGLPDRSTAGPRESDDGQRCQTLVLRSRNLRESGEWQKRLQRRARIKEVKEAEEGGETDSSEEEAEDDNQDGAKRDRIEFIQQDARGTVVNVAKMGDYCQVLWEATGLVGTYNTGHGGAYSLMLWTNRERVHRAWLTVSDDVRVILHDDLDVVIDEFLVEYNAATPQQHLPLVRKRMVGVPHTHPTPDPMDRCPRGSGLLQRLVHELDRGWMKTFTGFKDSALQVALQTPDERVRRSIDWDPFLAFFEWLAVHPPDPPEVFGGDQPTPGDPATLQKVTLRPGSDLTAPEAGPPRPKRAQKESEKKKKASPSAQQIAEVWLYIDAPLRLALQDSFPPEDFHAALMELMRRHIRRMHKTEFLQSSRRMSAGLRLGMSDKTIQALFDLADSDKDGYINFVDVQRTFRETLRARQHASQQSRRFGSKAKGGDANSGGGVGAAIAAWPDLVKKVFDRAGSLSFFPAADVCQVIDSRIRGVFPVLEAARRDEMVDDCWEQADEREEDDARRGVTPEAGDASPR